MKSTAGLEPLSRRALQAAALLGVLLIAVVVNSWLHSDGNPFNPLAAAAERTQASSGYSARLEATYSSPELPSPVLATGTVEYSAASGLAQATLTVPSPSGTVVVESVGDESHVYVRSGAFAGQLPDGAEWIGVEPFLGQSSPGFAGSDGATGALQMLRGVSGQVESLGSERVAGVETRRYRAAIDLGHLADLLESDGESALAEQYRRLDDLSVSPIQVEVWITPAGTVRQERVVNSVAGDDGDAPLTIDMRITIEKLGVKPEIVLPDSSQVYDATPLLRKQLGALGD